MTPTRFGVFDGAALVVATVVGAGIFIVPGYVARIAGSGGTALMLWAAGGAIALAGALCYAELAARYPRGGAEYIYLREAFGGTIGFLSGWTSFIAGFSGAIAAAAAGFAAHVSNVLPSMPRGLVAVTLIAACTSVSMKGIGMSRVATNTLTVIIISGILILGFAGALHRPPPSTGEAEGRGLGVLGALVPIFFTYSGWNAAAYVTGEFRNPARDVPRALILGTVVVTALYVGLNAAVLRAVPVAVMADDATPVATAAIALIGRYGSQVVTILILAALASSVCAMVVTGPRIYEEMARDGVLPSWFANRSNGAPRQAILAQSVWSSILVLSGTFEQIVTYTGFAIVVFSGAAVTALLVLRRRHGPPRTFSVPGYPVLPVAFVLSTCLIAVSSFRYAPGPSIAGVGLIGAGLLFRQRLAARPQ